MTQEQSGKEESRPSPSRFGLALAVVLACSALAMGTSYFEERLSPYEFDGDACQHVWWTYRWADPELFPNDPAFNFFSLTLFAPPGYQALYRAFVPHVDAQTFSETLPTFLMAFTALACFVAFTRWCGGRWAGSALMMFLLVTVFARYFRGGLPRSFALPVVAAFAWLSTSRRVWPLGVGLLIAVLFYPPPVVVLGLTSLVIIFARWRRGKLVLADLGAYAAITVLAVGVFAATYTFAKPDWIGKRPTPEQLRTMPQYQSGPDGMGSRTAVLGGTPAEFYLTSGRTGLGGRLLWLTPLLAIGVGAAAARRFRDAVPPFIPGLIAMSLLMFVAAHVLLPILFYPNRQVRYTVPVGILGIGALAVTWIADSLAARRPGLGRSGHRLAWLALLPLAAFAVYSAGRAVHIARTVPPPDPSLVAVVEFCRQTPKDTLFAGDPNDMDGIPMMARRNVLASHECTLAHYLGYYNIMLARVQDELRLLFATSWADAMDIARKDGVSYVVVPRNLLGEGRRRSGLGGRKFEADLVERARAEGAALLDPLPGRRVLRTEHYDVVDVRPAAGSMHAGDSPVRPASQ